MSAFTAVQHLAPTYTIEDVPELDILIISGGMSCLDLDLVGDRPLPPCHHCLDR
jgi:hypothetical protein